MKYQEKDRFYSMMVFISFCAAHALSNMQINCYQFYMPFNILVDVFAFYLASYVLYAEHTFLMSDERNVLQSRSIADWLQCCW